MITTKKSVFANLVFLPASPAITTSKEYWEEVGVKWAGEDFWDQFLNLEIPEAPEGKYLLQRLDPPTVSHRAVGELKRLGDKAKTPVSHLGAFLNSHRRKPGSFLTFAVGKDKHLWAVYFDWSTIYDSWILCSGSVDDTHAWCSFSWMLYRK